jgi:hypothetical protein
MEAFPGADSAHASERQYRLDPADVCETMLRAGKMNNVHLLIECQY